MNKEINCLNEEHRLIVCNKTCKQRDTNGAITLLHLGKSARSVTSAPNVLYGSTKRYHTDRSCSIKDANRK